VPPDRNGAISFPDIVLEDGDRLYVPSVPSVVNVVGEVNNESAFLYRPDKTMDDYLAQAGGPTENGEESAIYVLKADGAVLSMQGKGWFGGWFHSERIQPGDTVVVPIKLEKVSFIKEAKDWTQILYQFGIGAAALKVLKQ